MTPLVCTLEQGSEKKKKHILERNDSINLLRSHLGTLALKTEDFSKKTGRFSKTQKWIY